MIDSNELRIGNWVSHNGNWSYRNDEKNPVDNKPFNFKWESSDWYALGECTLFIEDVSPIPLTAEVLLKCGFDTWDRKLSTEYSKEVGNDGFKFKFIHNKEYNSNQLFLIGNGAYDDLGETDLTENCKYLNQLQNLYYALTGTELEIKL
jgi:hypothetical protein